MTYRNPHLDRRDERINLRVSQRFINKLQVYVDATGTQPTTACYEILDTYLDQLIEQLYHKDENQQATV